MLITIGLLLTQAGVIIAYGICLGLGFALSKVITEKIHEWSITLNPWKMKQLVAQS